MSLRVIDVAFPETGRCAQASSASAFTSQGCPWVRSQTVCWASGVNVWPVSSVCCFKSAFVSPSEKSPKRRDFALTLNALPPAMMACSAVERMR